MKNQIMARLFGLAVTFTAFAVFVAPQVMKRW
jgi:hypothetical protein